MQNPGAEFESRRVADVNVVTHKVTLDLENYALASQGSSIIASSEYSSDWPAAGAIDGDKTHINAGAASVAENMLGGSTWRSFNNSNGSGVISETLTISFGQVRKINRIKFLTWPHDTKNGNIGAVGWKDFLIQINPNVSGGSFSAWTGLTDKSAEVGKSATVISAGQVTGGTNDEYVFEDATLQSVGQIKVTITKLQAPFVQAYLCEMEATRTIDITEDVSMVTIDRRKDYRLNHRLAAEVMVSLTNYDRKYSPSYVPTAQELTDGYFNEELRPNLQLRYFAGFDGINVQMMTAQIDRIEPMVTSRIVTLKARDSFKFVIGKKITTNLKSDKSFEFLVELLANLCNIPSNDILLDATTATAAFFFPKDEDALDQMHNIGDALGDSEVFMDEFGRLNFRSYANVVSHIYFLTQQGDWAAGTNTNIDTATEPGTMMLSGGPTNFAPKGTFISAASTELTGFIDWGLFEAAYESGPYTSVDFFISASVDGINFEPFRRVYPGQSMKGFINQAKKIKIMAELRSSDITATPKVFDITVNYRARGGSRKYAGTAQATFAYNGELMEMSQVLTDEVGGANYMITKSFVKSKPTFRAAAQETAWQSINNGEIVSALNPLVLPVGDTLFNIDFGDRKFDVPQTVVITLGTAVATTSITSHPSKPILTISVTAAGTIEELYVQGYPFIQQGTVEAVAVASKRVLDLYGERQDVFENDFIDNKNLAQDIATSFVARFGQPLTWIPDAEFRFSPNLQINDRVRISETNTGLNVDFGVLSVMQEIRAIAAQELQVSTKTELVKIGAEGADFEPAYFSEFQFDAFRFGGNKIL